MLKPDRSLQKLHWWAFALQESQACCEVLIRDYPGGAAFIHVYVSLNFCTLGSFSRQERIGKIRFHPGRSVCRSCHGESRCRRCELLKYIPQFLWQQAWVLETFKLKPNRAWQKPQLLQTDLLNLWVFWEAQEGGQQNFPTSTVHCRFCQFCTRRVACAPMVKDEGPKVLKHRLH